MPHAYVVIRMKEQTKRRQKSSGWIGVIDMGPKRETDKNVVPNSNKRS